MNPNPDLPRQYIILLKKAGHPVIQEGARTICGRVVLTALPSGYRLDWPLDGDRQEKLCLPAFFSVLFPAEIWPALMLRTGAALKQHPSTREIAGPWQLRAQTDGSAAQLEVTARTET